MWHFAKWLKAQGLRVRYVKLDDLNNSGSFTGELQRAVAELKPKKIIVTEAGEYRVLEMMKSWQSLLGIPVEILPDTRFLATHAEFSLWTKGKKQLRMEFFIVRCEKNIVGLYFLLQQFTESFERCFPI